MRLKDKIAIVVGAGQSPGEGLGNGRATVLRLTSPRSQRRSRPHGDVGDASTCSTTMSA